VEKIAVIDLGTSSVRLVIANVLVESPEISHHIVFDELKETLSLVQDLDRDGFLKPPRIAHAVKTLQMFKRLCDAHKVETIHAFTTSSVRKAKNLKSFLEEISSVCGIKFRVLNEEDEAQFIYQGVSNSLDIPKGIIIDLGASTCQFINYNKRAIINRANLPFGAATLSQIFEDIEDDETKSEMITAYVLDQLSTVDWLETLEPDLPIIGVGGAFRNIAKLSRKLDRYPLAMNHNYTSSIENINRIYDMVRGLEPEKRSRIKGLSSQRADIFLPALEAIRAVIKLINGTKVTVSGAGIREGVMFNHTMPSTNERPILEIPWHSVNGMMRYFEVNIPHAKHVEYLSVQLYKQLRVLHKLPRQYVKVLRAAALLHDAGMRIKYYDHASHSFYYILNSNLYGFTHREIILAAFVALGHKHSGEFDMQLWNKFSSILKEEDLMAVMKLGLILRIAESLDRTMSSCIKNISCDVLGESVILKTESDCDRFLEIKDALTATADFAKVYRKNLEIL